MQQIREIPAGRIHKSVALVHVELEAKRRKHPKVKNDIYIKNGAKKWTCSFKVIISGATEPSRRERMSRESEHFDVCPFALGCVLLRTWV